MILYLKIIIIKEDEKWGKEKGKKASLINK